MKTIEGLFPNIRARYYWLMKSDRFWFSRPTRGGLLSIFYLTELFSHSQG